MDKKGKIDQIHDLLPKYFNSKNNTNWKAVVEALGEVDQDTADLIAQVRKQFFTKTASRPYLDRLAANNKVARPRLVGMDDQSFREYIPVLAYKPKQVKLIIDQLLDIFFFKESTTAFISSQSASPFALANGWELEILIDENSSERVKFSASEFTNIASATADEVVASINRQTKYSYATSYYDSITKSTYIKLFTKTIGSKGSLRVLGGRANIAFRFNGFIDGAGVGSNTQWTVTKVGDVTTFQHTSGTAPGLDKVQVGDVFISNVTSNIGSFKITNIDIANNKFSFINLFGTPGVFTQVSDTNSKFITSNKYVAYTNNRRAMTWETAPGEIVVEMPTSPPVVKRSLKGSWHVNGAFGTMTSRDSNTSLTLLDASGFSNAGSFYIDEVEETKLRWLSSVENTQKSYINNSRSQSRIKKYSYTSRTVLSTTGDIVGGTSQITNLGSVVGLIIGQSIDMVGIPAWAKITSIFGNNVNISVPATETSSSAAVSFLGNQLTGITPNLPAAASLNEFNTSSISRTSNVITVTTPSAHGYLVNEYAVISGCNGIVIHTTTGNLVTGTNQITSVASVSGVSPGQLIIGSGIPSGTKVTNVVGFTVTMDNNATGTFSGSMVKFAEDLNGPCKIISTTTNTFTATVLGSDGSPTIPGTVRVERAGLSTSGSKIYLTDAVLNTSSRITGTYVWDTSAPFVLSSNKANLINEIKAGKIVRLMEVDDPSIPDGGGFLIFDYGQETQEGPVRYLYKPTPTTVAIDPSYVFQKNHSAGSAATAINAKGPHVMTGRGLEYAPYITNPSEARLILQELIKSVKSAGIFVQFLIRFPEQIFATLDTYNSGVDPG